MGGIEDKERLEDLNLMSVTEVARRLDYSERYIYELIKNDDLPAIKLSPRKILIAESDLLDWIKSKRNTPN